MVEFVLGSFFGNLLILKSLFGLFSNSSRGDGGPQKKVAGTAACCGEHSGPTGLQYAALLKMAVRPSVRRRLNEAEAGAVVTRTSTVA